MPQIKVEYSKNITGIDFQSFFALVHNALATISKVSRCKSRAICLQNYYIGDGDHANALFFIKISIMPGRTQQQKDKLAELIGDAIKTLIIPKIELLGLNCIPTMEIADLQYYTDIK